MVNNFHNTKATQVFQIVARGEVALSQVAISPLSTRPHFWILKLIQLTQEIQMHI